MMATAFVVPQMDDEFDAEVKAKAEAMRRQKAKLAAKAAEGDHVKAKRQEAASMKKAAEAQAWSEAQKAAEARAAAKENTASNAGSTVLQAIQQLATQAAEHEEHAERAARLESVLGDTAVKMRQRARRRSKELQEQVLGMLDGTLEETFHSFDTDGSGTLDVDELSKAYRAAGIKVTDEGLHKCMKLLDSNGDGVIDLSEFKSIALKLQMDEHSA